jgi:hypothetical protein
MVWAVALLVGVASFTSSSLFAQKVEIEGKAWLEAKTGPPEINVNGSWASEDWGAVLLNQTQGSREVTGASDNWEISGVVSGKEVFLLFSSKGRVGYSAELSLEQANTLTGHCFDGMPSQGAKTRFLTLRMPNKTEAAGAGAGNASAGVTKADPARVVVYREKHFNCSKAKPAVYNDGKELGQIHNGRYFTVTLPPGKHLIGASTMFGNHTVELNAEPAATYYYKIEFTSNWACIYDIDKINTSEAINALQDLRPADAKHVKMPEIVSVSPIAGK